MFTADRRALEYPLTSSLVLSAVISEDEPDCGGSSSVIFPDDPDERTVIPFLLSLNEYNVLASAIDVGSDIAYGADAIAVMWLWLRNTRCMEMICDWIQDCTVEAIGKATGLDQFQRNQATAAALQERYASDYTGTPSSVNPDTFDTNFDGSASDDDRLVLCSAAEAFVKLFAAQKAQQLKLTYGGLAAVLALITLLVPGLGWILAAGIYIAIGAAVLVGGVAYAAAIEALEDETALQDVSCCLKDSLAGLSVTEAHWNAALGSCGFGVGTNSAIVRDFVAAALADNYLTFLDALGTAKHAQDEGEPVDCLCDQWESILDFTVSDYGFDITFAGAWASGVGFEDTYYQYTGGNGYRAINIALALALPSRITEARLYFDYTAGTIDSSGDSTALVCSETPEFIINVVEPSIPVSPQEGSGDAIFNTIYISLMCGVIVGTGDPGGTCTLTEAVLRGRGVKPAELP